MRMTQMDTILIRMLYLAAAGIVMLTVLGAESIASGLFYLTFVLVVLLWLAGAMREVSWTDAVLILIVGLTLGHIMINASLEGTSVNFDYFKKYIMFIITLVFFQAACKLSVDDRTEKFLLTVNSGLVLFLIGYFCFHQTEVYLLGGRTSNYLTFGFTNPNLTALFLMCLFTGEMYQLFRSRSVPALLWHLCLAAAVFYFVWETESRNCLITIVVEALLFGLLYLLPKGFRISKLSAFLVAVWPFVFALLYLVVVRTGWIQEMFSFMVSEGKGLDARLSVWLPALYYYGKSPIWGAYSQISGGTGMSQMHNTHLDILVSYGTVVFILVCYLLYSLLSSKNTGVVKEDTMARICFAGTIIMGMGEASLFSGGLGLYLFAGLFLLLCDREGNRPPEGSVGESGL